MMVDWEQVKEDYAMKDARIADLEGIVASYEYQAEQNATALSLEQDDQMGMNNEYH